MSAHPSEHTQSDSGSEAGGLQHRWRSWTRGQIRDRDREVNPLHNVSAATLKANLEKLRSQLPSVSSDELNRAAEVAREPFICYQVALQPEQDDALDIRLTTEERHALKAEREKLFSQRRMLVIIATISLAAFLQGHVQSSINAGSLFTKPIGLDTDTTTAEGRVSGHEWKLGGMNASPFWAASLLGAPLSLPVNYCIGRRGSLALSALLIIASSLGSAFSQTWVQVLGARIVGGVGMGIKAVSAPILASETAVGFWRGSTILAWQLWVACGIMIGFVINLVIGAATEILEVKLDDNNERQSTYLTLQLILGAPMVPAVFLFVLVCYCYESPRFYMRPNTPNFDLDRAFRIMKKVRQTELQALRDILLIWWPNKDDVHNYSRLDEGMTYAGRTYAVTKLSLEQYKTLFGSRRLRNAVWSSCTVNLAQQLCGVNVFAFYSNNIFTGSGAHVKDSMIYSFGFGAVNFFFGLLSMRSIDTIGRRRWLLSTLPLMCLFLMASAVSYSKTPNNGVPNPNTASSIVGVVFIYLFAAAYSPGLGPIPFTLASESFPLTHREAGASVAISINLFFAGLLTILVPTIQERFKIPGTLGFFAGLNVVAFVLVYFLVAETRQVSLEGLDRVYDIPMRKFAAHQWQRLLGLVKRWVFWQRGTEVAPSDDAYAMNGYLRDTMAQTTNGQQHHRSNGVIGNGR